VVSQHKSPDPFQEFTGDALSQLRDLKPKNKLRPDNPEDYFKRIVKIQGSVVSAKNLANMDTWSKSDPYCVVKGIRSNNHLVDIFVTRAISNSLSPVWSEDFSFVCPENWGLVELVGLKFLVYDSDERYVSFMGSDDFLGGTDVDLSELRSGKCMEYERDLEAGPRKRARIFKMKKPRITIKVTVFHEYTQRPLEFNELLLDSLDTFSRVISLECHIVRAKNLSNMDLRGKSDPQVVVRVILVSGAVRELHRTAVIQNTLDPVWHERFHALFLPTDEPMLLIFDVYDDDDGGDCTVIGDHLGSAWASIFSFRQMSKQKLRLLGESQLLESLLTKEGISMSASVEGAGVAQSKKATHSL